MAHFLFYFFTALWGSAWLAIKSQRGSIAPAILLAWRFALAAPVRLAQD